MLTKLLAQETCRVFADAYRIACPVLLFGGLVNPDILSARQVHPFSVSWADSGRAIRAAATITSLPRPSPVVHVLAESPHDRYDTSSTGEVLDWHPQDRLDHLWR